MPRISATFLIICRQIGALGDSTQPREFVFPLMFVYSVPVWNIARFLFHFLFSGLLLKKILNSVFFFPSCNFHEPFTPADAIFFSYTKILFFHSNDLELFVLFKFFHGTSLFFLLKKKMVGYIPRSIIYFRFEIAFCIVSFSPRRNRIYDYLMNIV